MALTVLTVLDAATREIQKSHTICQSYISQSENQGLKNLLLSICDQDKENEKQLEELKGEQFGFLHEQKIEINITDFSGSTEAQKALNDKYFLLLYSEQKKLLSELFRKIASFELDEDFTYTIAQIADVSERQYALLKNRYDLLVL